MSNKPIITVTTEIHCHYANDTVVAATRNNDDTLTLTYYKEFSDYLENEELCRITITQELLAEILRVFPCPQV